MSSPPPGAVALASSIDPAETAAEHTATSRGGAAHPPSATSTLAPGIKMLHDRLLVSTEGEDGERRSSSGIVIPSTATLGKRLAWARVVALGQNVRQVQLGDRVLYDPEERAEVELAGTQYVLLRERDLHAVAAPNPEVGQPGLYL